MNIYEFGVQKGLEDGRKIGEKKGEKRGKKKVNRLIALLLEQSRFEDIQKMVTNEEYQKQLFKEFNL